MIDRQEAVPCEAERPSPRLKTPDRSQADPNPKTLPMTLPLPRVVQTERSASLSSAGEREQKRNVATERFDARGARIARERHPSVVDDPIGVSRGRTRLLRASAVGRR
jgi:hypothetical protein